MNWLEVCEDAQLQNISYKVELNRFGQIVMSPASNEHGYFQTEIASEMRKLKRSGMVITECSIDTTDGVKVADVAWGSNDFFSKTGLVTPLPYSPEICVEIISPTNSPEALKLKAGLYFESGAKEVWFCDAKGNIEFIIGKEKMNHSLLFQDFPKKISFFM